MRIFIAAIAFLAISLPAQADSADEFLRCLPEGSYAQISFGVTRGYEHTEAYQFYTSMREKYGMKDKRSVIPNFRFLPPELKEVVTSSTSAKLFDKELIEFPKPRTIDAENFEVEIKRIRKEYSYGYPLHVFDYEKQQYFVYGIWRDLGEYLYVKRLENYEEARKQAIGSGNLVVSGHSLQGEPVFSFSTTIRRATDGGSDLFCWFSEQGEMLIAPTVELLERMVAAATGEGPSVLDQPENNPVFALLPQAGYRWSVLFGVSEREMNATIRKYEMKHQHQQGISQRYNAPLYRISTTEMNENYIERGYEVYESAEIAQEALERAKGSAKYYRRKEKEQDQDGEQGKFQAQLAEREMNTKRSIDGNMITTEFVYDREYIKKHMEWVNEMRGKMLKRLDDAGKKAKDDDRK